MDSCIDIACEVIFKKKQTHTLLAHLPTRKYENFEGKDCVLNFSVPSAVPS